MKKNRLSIFILITLLLSLTSSCYEPIANTSGGPDGDSEDERASRSNDNTSVENMKKPENTDNSGTNKDSEGKAEIKTNVTLNAGDFRGNLSKNLSRTGLTINDIYDSGSSVEKRILAEYGSVFLTTGMPPSKVMFTSEAEVSAFQSKAGSASATIGGASIVLQPEALKALQDAIAEAKSSGVTITPRDPKDSAQRSYQQTLELWNDRFNKGCEHWKGKGRLTVDQISRLKGLPIKEQVSEVLELEKKGIYFNTFFNNSILYSVAAPGTSQHLSMLAFDAKEFQNKKVREIMAKHGWFRTVQNDEPHFTYLGHPESDLSRIGLKKVFKKDGEFWIPQI